MILFGRFLECGSFNRVFKFICQVADLQPVDVAFIKSCLHVNALTGPMGLPFGKLLRLTTR